MSAPDFPRLSAFGGSSFSLSDDDRLLQADLEQSLSLVAGEAWRLPGGATTGNVATLTTAPPAVRELADQVARLWNELHATRQALRRCEAELAAGVPLVEHRSEATHLADRLESVLQGGAQVLGCTSAALYLLDERSSHLDLRSVYGLPLARFTQPARELARAPADLEALLGHAIVLDDVRQHTDLLPPEPANAALCVPVSSPTTVLGTVWFYCDHPRPFSDEEVNLAEIIAGLLAADLEREVLLAGAAAAREAQEQIEAAERIQRTQLPRVKPDVEGIQAAAWTQPARRLAGDFHDWLVLPDERLFVAVADCLDGGFDASLCGNTLRGGLRALVREGLSPEMLVARLNDLLWSASPGDQFAHLFCGLLEARSGRLVYASAGSIASAVVTRGAWHRLAQPTIALGIDPDTDFQTGEVILPPGGTLLVATDGVLESRDGDGEALSFENLIRFAVPHLSEPVEALVERCRELIHAWAHEPIHDDQTLLALRRRR